MKKISVLFGVLFTILLLSLWCAPNVSSEASAKLLVNNNSMLPASRSVFNPYPSPYLPGSSSLLLPPSPAGESIVIIVENTLWGNSAIQTAVNTYRTDLNNTGYNTILYTTAIANVQTLRSLLQGWYTNNQTTGAVLIGPLPFAQFYHPASGQFSVAETFVCDLFLMDLDGSWYDVNPADGVYDVHNATGGNDIFPEIYVGRIDASTRTLGSQTNANNIISLLNRIHSYRTGGVARQHRALTYIDDDWQSYADGTLDNWPAWMNTAYPTRTDVHTPATWTNATDWLTNRLTQDYEFTHLAAHSCAQKGGWAQATHFFGPGGGASEGTVTATQIHNQQPTFNFYNLFACSGADWNTPDCLGMTYLFSSQYSLAVIGTTKTGGMLGGTSFYNSLGNNNTLGQALSDWFQGMTGYAGQYLEWFYGMTLMGDPFLTTHYDITALPPVISSITHPNQTQWYGNALPQFSWTTPPDVNGVSGYYFVLDTNPTTIPTSSTGTYATGNTFTPVINLNDGHWFLHIVTNDSLGNIGTEAAHFQVNIDTAGPTTSIIAPPSNYNSSSSTVNLIWSASDIGIGYTNSSVWLDSTTNLYSGPNLSYIATGLTQGAHIINVTTMDYLMNAKSAWITIHVDLTNPICNIISHSNGDIVASNIILSWSANDGETGYRYAEVSMDGILTSTIQGPATSTSLLGLSLGNHTISVTVYDWSGRSDSDQIIVNVQGLIPPPGIPGFPFETIALGLLLAICVGLLRRRQKQKSN